VTSVTGLSGGTITTSETSAVSFAGSGSASTAARSDHNHTGTYLPAAAASCPAGATIQQINSDGTVVCQTAAARPGFAITTLDSTGNVGLYTSITIGTDGPRLISYQDGENGDLKVAHCSNTLCTPNVRRR
jgi:hypothetical protein